MDAICTPGEPEFSKMLQNIAQKLQARGRVMVTAELPPPAIAYALEGVPTAFTVR